VLIGLQLTLHPFVLRPSYKAIANLPLAERVQAMRDPALKARILGEANEPDLQPLNNMLIAKTAEMFVLRDPVNYAPPVSEQIGARATGAGVSVESFAYDVLLEDDGQVILCLPGANYVGNTLDSAREMMASPHTVIGVGDGGAHYGFICDASYPTFMLTHWARDESGAGAFPLEWIVQALTSKPAQTVKLLDRGLLSVGYKADINIIDAAAMELQAPRVVRDLPAGGRRLQQRAQGYVATIVNGVVTYRNGEATGALPGRLVRGGAWVQPLERAA
jgi:N-acyl-D-aspartate/D-glutamate deacylase